MSSDLLLAIDGHPHEVPVIGADIRRIAAFSLEVLGVAEQWDTEEVTTLHLGAWAWGLRLWERNIRIGDVLPAPSVRAAIGPALRDGCALVRALGAHRTVLIEPDVAGLSIDARGEPADPAALEAAVGRLVANGMDVRRVDGLSHRMLVRSSAR